MPRISRHRAPSLMVAQTGWGQAEDRARTLDAGFDARLTKPVDPAILQDLLASLTK